MDQSFPLIGVEISTYEERKIKIFLIKTSIFKSSRNLWTVLFGTIKKTNKLLKQIRMYIKRKTIFTWKLHLDQPKYKNKKRF